MMPPGVYVCGPSRSGTNMVGGLFREHGVFFGDCNGPSGANPKGYVENLWLKRYVHGFVDEEWPAAFFDQLYREGWDGESPWGVKVGPQHWPTILELAPSAVVTCYRPIEDIMRSRAKIANMREVTPQGIAIIRRHVRWLEWVAEKEGVIVVKCETNDLVTGAEWHQLTPAFEAIGLEPDANVFAEWIDANHWNRA